MNRARFFVSFIIFSLFHEKIYGQDSEDCEPELSDQCFDRLYSDVRNIIDVNRGIATNVTDASVKSFCISAQSAINCTQDIIDASCSEDPRKVAFDEWIWTFKLTFNHMCHEKFANLTDLFSSVNCWNINTFFQCTRNAAGISKVEDLFYKPLDENECRTIIKSLNMCDQKAKMGMGSCRELYGYRAEISDLISVFLHQSHCLVTSGCISIFWNEKIYISITLIIIQTVARLIFN